MDMYTVAASLRREPWGLWIGGFLLALDGLILPFWAAWLIAVAGGVPGRMELVGIVLPTWVSLLLGPMAILSVVAVIIILRARRELGFRVASSVAIAWIAVVGIAWATGAVPAEALIERVVILALLVQGRTVRPDSVVAL